MLKKGELGIGYLVGIGIGLVVSSMGHLVFVDASLTIYWIGRLVTAGLGVTLVLVAVWLKRSGLSDTHAWQTAVWCSVGLAVPTVGGVLITVLQIYPPIQSLFQSLFIILIAAGGVIGVLAGAIVQLDKEYSTTQSLAQRTSVLHRVLRHNIRNEMNIILAYADRIPVNGESSQEIADQIKRRGNRIVELSHAVRNIDRIDDRDSHRPVNVGAVIDERIENARVNFPHADISASTPESAWAKANGMLHVIVDNLIENAIEHNDQTTPGVHVSVRHISQADEFVEIKITDDGPGIPESELDVLDQESETDLQHGSGIGLWLVTWFVESLEGELEFHDNSPNGTSIVIRLPSTPPVRQPQSDRDRALVTPGDDLR